MSRTRASVAVIALAFVAACARQEHPATSTAGTVLPAPPASSPTPKRSDEASSLGSVRSGNQLPLNSAAVAFAKYLNGIHNRLHREFADKELQRLDTLPPNHPMNDTKLVTRVELVIEGETGLLSSLRVVRGSGIAEFDAVAVESVKRAAPFDDAPSQIRSADGNVYVHWEFRRDEVFACSTMHARPFLLSIPAGPPSPPSLAL